MRYHEALNIFVRATLDEAERQAWRVVNLNDNDKRWIVKGQAWQIFQPNGELLCRCWNEIEVALALAPRLQL